MDTFISNGRVWEKMGPSRTTRTPETVEGAGKAVFRPPKRYAREYAAALTISERPISYSYKLALVQKLDPGDFVLRERACEVFIDNLPHGALTRHISVRMSD